MPATAVIAAVIATLQLSNRWARLGFSGDPRQATRQAAVNGIAIWLCFPLVYRDGNPCISRLDLDDTLAPLISPPATIAGRHVATICLDPGHGGKDPGFEIGTKAEKNFTLLLAREVRDQLRRAGFRVILTRDTDASVPLENRPALAGKRHADLFLSFHFNSAGPQHPDVSGVETYCLTPAGAPSTNAGGEGDSRPCPGNRNNAENLRLAYELQRALTRDLPADDRGIKRARYQVLREAAMPAALIEGGFMSNPAESKRIFNATYRRQMAQAIVKGILAWQGACGKIATKP